MSLSSTRARLTALTRQLEVDWKELRSQWRDEQGREFERVYMQELFAQVDRTNEAIEALEKTLNHARRDCE